MPLKREYARLGERVRSSLLAVTVALAGTMLGGAAVAHAESPPVNKTLPTITPSYPEEEVFEYATDGTWKNKPTSYKVEWERCKSSCEYVENFYEAFGKPLQFKPTAADVGYTLRVKVTAKNAGGEASAYSEPTQTVQAAFHLTKFTTENPPEGIAGGPESNLWFTENGGGKRSVADVTPGGAITKVASWEEIVEPLEEIEPGAYNENALWFRGVISAGVTRLSTEGSTINVALGTNIGGFTGGAEKEGEWVTEPSKSEVVRITPAGKVSTKIKLAASDHPRNIARNENTLFMTEPGHDKVTVVEISSKTATDYTISGEPGAITGGAKGAGEAWFVNTTKHTIDSINNEGHVTEYEMPQGIVPTALAFGADGRLWFNDEDFPYVGSINEAGEVSTTYLGPEVSWLKTLAAVPDGPIWFINAEGKIGNFTI